MIVLACILLIAFSVFLSSCLRIKHKIAYLLSLFLLSYANLVLVSQIASLIHQLNQAFFLLTHGIFALIAWLVWRRAGKPFLLGPFKELPSLKGSLSQLPRNVDLMVLFIAVCLAYLLGALLILFTPQNNFDSMTYHLSRVGYWLQHNSLFPWTTPNPRQTSFPINAELGILWTVLFWGSAQLSGFVQWIMIPITGLVIIGFARLFGASRKQGLFAALIWASFPEIFLQSITTMNDLVVTAFFSSAVYLGFLGLRENNRHYLLMAGLGIGLALGTKSTAFILLPGFVLGVAIILLQNWKANFKKCLTWGIASLAAFGLVGSLGYIQNFIYYHDPFSVPQWTAGLVHSRVSRGELFFENSLLYLTQAIDWTGLPPAVYQPLTQFQVKVTQKLISYLPFAGTAWFTDGRQYLNFILYSSKSIHEDLAWFGPLFLLLYIPSGIYNLVIGIKRKDAQRLALLLLTYGFGLTISIMIAWTPYKGRYFPLAVIFCAPFLADLFQSSKKWVILRWVITLAAVTILCRTALLNQSKPLLGKTSIWGNDALAVQTINNQGMEPVIRMVEKNVPANSRLATRLSLNSWDFPLFGENFQRTIIQVDPISQITATDWFQEQAIDYLLIEPASRSGLRKPPGLELVDQANGWMLFRPCPTSQCQPEAESENQLMGAEDKDNLLTIAPELVGEVGVLQLRPNAWGIEQLDGKGILWLGEGPLHGLTGYLWAETARTVHIQIELEPGPSKASLESTLLFSLYWVRGYEYLAQGRISQESQFNRPAVLTYSVNLHQGLNEFRLSSRDIAEFRNFANGDTRPLLILVKHISVEE